MTTATRNRKQYGECWECATVGIVAHLGTDVGPRPFCEDCYTPRQRGLAIEAWDEMADPPQPVKFQLSWQDDDLAVAIAVQPPPYEAVKVGELWFNGNEWFFIRVDRNGEQIMDGLHYIEVDPEQEQAFRREQENILVQFTDRSSAGPLLQELDGRRKIYRDDSKEVAAMGAKVEARRWWPDFWNADSDNVD